MKFITENDDVIVHGLNDWTPTIEEWYVIMNTAMTRSIQDCSVTINGVTKTVEEWQDNPKERNDPMLEKALVKLEELMHIYELYGYAIQLRERGEIVEAMDYIWSTVHQEWCIAGNLVGYIEGKRKVEDWDCVAKRIYLNK